MAGENLTGENEADFREWTNEFEGASSPDAQKLPFGATEMIPLDVEQAAGMLACVYGLGSGNVDDDQSGDQVSKSDDPLMYAHPNFSYETNIGDLN